VNFLIGYHEPNECIKILFIVEAKILCLALGHYKLNQKKYWMFSICCFRWN